MSSATCETDLVSNDFDHAHVEYKASSSWNGTLGVYYGPDRSMLNSTLEYAGEGRYLAGGWRALEDDLNQFIQVKTWTACTRWRCN